jgi:hypothetical protein
MSVALSEGCFIVGLDPGAAGFALAPGYLLPHLRCWATFTIRWFAGAERFVVCAFDDTTENTRDIVSSRGEELAAAPGLNPDTAIIHAQRRRRW